MLHRAYFMVLLTVVCRFIINASASENVYYDGEASLVSAESKPMSSPVLGQSIEANNTMADEGHVSSLISWTGCRYCCYTAAIIAILLLCVIMCCCIPALLCGCCCKSGVGIIAAGGMEMQVVAGTGRRTVNLLLVGEIGVGKTTWINGCISYMRYETLRNALLLGPADEHLVPASFTVHDKYGVDHRIEYGSVWNRNEELAMYAEVGQRSTTHLPRTYRLQASDDVEIRLIDTAGMGNTVQGPDEDKKNTQYILEHLNNIDELHGVLVLLPPNADEAHLSLVLSLCIRPLIEQLDYGVGRNILICYTNTRETGYRPLDSTLTKTLQMVSEEPWAAAVTGLTEPDGVFCFDNEAVRYLMTTRSSVTLSEPDLAHAETSWDRSSAETARLLRRAALLPPHRTRRTASSTSNAVRNTILAMSRPIVETRQAVVANMAAIVAEHRRVTDGSETARNRLRQKQLQISDLGAMTLQQAPRLTCYSTKCVIIEATRPVTIEVKSSSNVTTPPVAVCCSVCDVPVGANQVGVDVVQRTDAMITPLRSACRRCGCQWKAHVIVTYETYRTEGASLVRARSNVPTRTPRDEYSALCSIADDKVQLEKVIADLNQERRELDRVIAVCEAFLTRKAVYPYTDTMTNLMAWCKLKYADTVDDDDTEVTTTVQFLQVQDRDLEPNRVFSLLVSLYRLRTTGPMLNRIMIAVEEGEKQVVITTEVPFNVERNSTVIRYALH